MRYIDCGLPGPPAGRQAPGYLPLYLLFSVCNSMQTKRSEILRLKNRSALIHLANAPVTTQLDYCNYLYITLQWHYQLECAKVPDDSKRYGYIFVATIENHT